MNVISLTSTDRTHNFLSNGVLHFKLDVKLSRYHNFHNMAANHHALTLTLNFVISKNMIFWGNFGKKWKIMGK